MFKVIKVIIVTFKHLKILNFFSLDKNYAQLMAHKDSVARLLFMLDLGRVEHSFQKVTAARETIICFCSMW